MARPKGGDAIRQHVMIPRDVMERLRAQAAAERRNLSSMLAAILDQVLPKGVARPVVRVQADQPRKPRKVKAAKVSTKGKDWTKELLGDAGGLGKRLRRKGARR